MNCLKNIVTFGPIGYFFASGTFASLLTLPLIYFLSKFNFKIYIIAFIFLFILSYLILNKSLKKFQTKDPSEIVIDEFLGCILTFFMIPINFKSLILGFLLFRFFDIIKPFGLKKIEKIYGAFGILLDDIFAGLISNLILKTIYAISIY